MTSTLALTVTPTTIEETPTLNDTSTGTAAVTSLSGTTLVPQSKTVMSQSQTIAISVSFGILIAISVSVTLIVIILCLRRQQKLRKYQIK